MPAAPPLERHEVHEAEKLLDVLEIARDRRLGARAEAVLAQPLQQPRDATAHGKARLEGMREEPMLLGERVEQRKRIVRRLTLTLQPAAEQAQHDRTRRREQRIAAAHLLEAAAVHGHVPPHAQVDKDDVVAFGWVARVAAQMVLLILPERVLLEQRSGQEPKEQP